MKRQIINHVILRKKSFDSDDDLPSNKLLKLHKLTIVFRSGFEEEDKYYLQSCLDEFLYEL